MEDRIDVLFGKVWKNFCWEERERTYLEMEKMHV